VTGARLRAAVGELKDHSGRLTAALLGAAPAAEGGAAPAPGPAPIIALE